MLASTALDVAAVALNEANDRIEALRESLADVRERMVRERVSAVEAVRRDLANAHAMLHEWQQMVEDARQDKADLRARVAELEAAQRWVPVGERLPDGQPWHERLAQWYSRAVGDIGRSAQDEADVQALRGLLARHGADPGWKPCEIEVRR